MSFVRRQLLVATCLLAIMTSGCLSQEMSSESTTGYRYSVQQYDISGHVILSGSDKPSVVERYRFGFRASDLDAISNNREIAIYKFIERREAAPVECKRGIHIHKHGLSEAGGAWAVVECAK